MLHAKEAIKFRCFEDVSAASEEYYSHGERQWPQIEAAAGGWRGGLPTDRLHSIQWERACG